MKKTAALAFRVSEPLKHALEKAARDDSRSVSGMVEKIIADWLVDHGYGGGNAEPRKASRKK